MNITRTSKFLSLVLRHKPEKIGVALDDQGWVSVDELLTALRRHGRPLSFEQLEHVVETNDKRRFAFNEERTRIRAVHGHSVEIDLGYMPARPPDRLYHGTVERFLPSIREKGLAAGKRQQVHLSPDTATAVTVGERRGKPVVLTIDAKAMHEAGHSFFVSDSGVWLTDAVPPQYIIDWG